MWERFNDKAKRVILLAQDEATRLGQIFVTVEHLLLGVIREKQNLGYETLNILGVDFNLLKQELEAIFPKQIVKKTKEKQFHRTTKTILEYSFEEAGNLGMGYIGTEHLLLGILHEGNTIAAQSLINQGITYFTVKKQLLTIAGFEIRHSDKSHLQFKYSKDSMQKFFILAYEEAKILEHKKITIDHLFLALFQKRNNNISMILQNLKINMATLQNKILYILIKQNDATNISDKIAVQETYSQYFSLAFTEAQNLGVCYIDTEHWLLAILKERTSITAQVLKDCDITYEKVFAEVRKISQK